MDFGETLRILRAAQGDPAQLALATVELLLAGKPPNEQEKLRIALEAVAVPHWFDERVLSRVLASSDTDTGALMGQLRSLSVVESFPARGAGAANVHGTARVAIRCRLQREAPDRFRELSYRACKCFEDDDAPHSLIEMLYHLWITSPERASQICNALLLEWSETHRYKDLLDLGVRLHELIKCENLDVTAREVVLNQHARVRRVFDSLAEFVRRAQEDLGGEPIPPIFVCYARKDNEAGDASKRWLDRLLEFLAPMRRDKLIALFCDNDIRTGENWHERIQAQLAAAKVAVIMVSQSLLASEYIANSELPVLLQKAAKNGLKIIAILVRPCSVTTTKFKFPDPKFGPEEFSFATIQTVNPLSKALSEMTEPEQDHTFQKVADDLREFVGC